ncbi:DMT family transporter [Marinoscillum pacificum]|uniref:DMT family transporter n=1 Tax=Marinoscillum pacificum TaxID=392723 RepID=UPI0021578FF8|nr:DMT family transporter [Marinoscillum pacificum]
MNQNRPSHFLQFGLAIAIMSTSGTLGRYIELPPPAIIWIRCVIGSIALFLVMKALKLDLTIGTRKGFWFIVLGGILLGGHWVTYFYALQLSTVAIGMLSLFTYPVITSILEPIILKTKFQPFSIVLAIISLVGVSFLVPELSLDNSYTVGILIGILSAVCYSFRNILLKKQIANQSGMSLMFYQLLVISLLGWPMLWAVDVSVESISMNWKGLLILGLLTTATGHTLFTFSFKHFTASTVSILSALTPLLGTLYGYLFLSEVPAGNTFIGGALIFTTVIAESIRSMRK